MPTSFHMMQVKGMKDLKWRSQRYNYAHYDSDRVGIHAARNEESVPEQEADA